MFFHADDGIHGKELWASDGTPAGTRLVRDINPGPFGLTGSTDFAPTQMVNLGEKLFLIADDGTHGPALWQSDGSEAGTSMIKAATFSLLVSNGQSLFLAARSSPAASLWRSDGTTAGTTLIQQFDPGASYVSVKVEQLLVTSQRIFFMLGRDIWTDRGQMTVVHELWASDGTAAGTQLVKQLMYMPQLVVASDTLFFSDNGLWKSDGTSAGTTLITSMGGLGLAAVGSKVFFNGTDADHGAELWQSDGTPAGTALVRDIAPGPDGSFPSELTAVGNRLFFKASTSPGITPALWKSDGTADGTQLLKNVDAMHLTDIGGTLLFSGSTDRLNDYELWASDGTPEGTTLVQDLAPGELASDPQKFTVSGGSIFFSAHSETSGRELWSMPFIPDVGGYVRPQPLAGVPPGGLTLVAVRYGNLGLAAATSITLTATLDPALEYVGDSAGIAPMRDGNTLSWRLPGLHFGEASGFMLRVKVPIADFGTRYPIAFALSSTGSEATPSDNTATTQIMIAHTIYLPSARRS